MFFLRKEWLLCVLIGCLGWVSVALAEEALVQQNQAASTMVPAPVAASALPEMAPPPLDMAAASMKKDGICTRCHDESETKPILAIYQTKHGVKADLRTPNCQSCHGESEKHLKDRAAPDVLFGTKRGTSGSFVPSDATVQNAACLSCHRKDANRSHWEGSTHQRENVACASCHTIHNAHDKVRDKRTQPEVCFACHKEQRAQINLPSHHPIPEGEMGCSACHNPHGSIGPKLMKRDSVNETCYTCHMEKRGPFVHEHEPVGEDCTICHNPHGTTAENMLKMRPPFLCQSCHTPHSLVQPSLNGQTASNSPGWWNGAAITQGRGCVNCHSEIHGSNNPNAANNPLFR